jgi:hypothetical protein
MCLHIRSTLVGLHVWSLCVSAMEIYSRCFASKSVLELLYTDLRDEAMWQQTTVRTLDFIQNAIRLSGSAPALCNIRGWSADTILFDTMHNLFIGIGKDLCGAALCRLIEVGYYSKSEESEVHLKVFVQQCRKWCHKHNVALHPPKLDKYSVKHLPEKASKVKDAVMPELDVKAAYVKLFLVILAHEMYVASICGDEEIRALSLCLYHCASWIAVLNTAGMFLKSDEAGLAVFHGDLFLKSYRYLAAFSVKLNRPRYKLRPKFHCLDHTIKDLKVWSLNPFYATCFMDEDFMGKIKCISSHCHAGTMVPRTFSRYSIMIGYRWRKIARTLARSGRVKK